MVKRYYVNSELYHHGILGQKWGVRRYQNPDGTLTAEGKRRERSSFKDKVKSLAGNEKFKKYAKIGAAVVGSMIGMYALSLTPVGSWISSQMSAINAGINFKNNMSKEITSKPVSAISNAGKIVDMHGNVSTITKPNTAGKTVDMWGRVTSTRSGQQRTIGVQ